jgi:AP2 domain/HNH endonuclease
MSSNLLLPGGFSTVVDDDDLARILPVKWSTFITAGCRYANGSVAGRTVLLHRFITSAPDGLEVDHRDGDGLNNQRINLRFCTHALNLANQRPRTGCSSKFKGVSFDKRKKKWEAYIMVNQKRSRMGWFNDEEEAARAYDVAAIAAWGEFARPNFSACGS